MTTKNTGWSVEREPNYAELMLNRFGESQSLYVTRRLEALIGGIVLNNMTREQAVKFVTAQESQKNCSAYKAFASGHSVAIHIAVGSVVGKRIVLITNNTHPDWK